MCTGKFLGFLPLLLVVFLGSLSAPFAARAATCDSLVAPPPLSPAPAPAGMTPLAGPEDCADGGCDPDTWAPQSADAHAWRAVTYGGSQFVAVSSGGESMTSADGITWTTTSNTLGGLTSVTYGNSLYVAVSDTNIKTSPDATTWTTRTAVAGTSGYTGVAYGNGTFVITSASGFYYMLTSVNGTAWTRQNPASSGFGKAIVFGGGQFVIVNTNKTYTSSDGLTWASQTVPSGTWITVGYGNGLYVAGGADGKIMTSPDGVTWTQQTTPDNNKRTAIAYGNGKYIALSDGGTDRVITSPDGVTWTAGPAAEDNSWAGMATDGSVLAAVATDGTNRVMTLGCP